MPMLGQHTFMGSTAKPLATDASIDATKQTAAGVALPLLELFLFPLGDLEFRGLFCLPGLLDGFLPGLLDVFLPPFFPLELDLAGVACLGFPAGPLCEKLHLSPRSQRPLFQKMHSFFLPLPLGDWVLDGDRPRLESLLGLVDGVLLDGTSCLNVQFSLVQPPLFHLTH